MSIKNGDFSWEKDAVQPILEDINLTVKKGQLLGVLGRVGAGKVSHILSIAMSCNLIPSQTSLLSAIIGDMTRREGSVTIRGTVAYAPQNPW